MPKVTCPQLAELDAGAGADDGAATTDKDKVEKAKLRSARMAQLQRLQGQQVINPSSASRSG